jgi:tripartite-type tricarboxylate transporter receptor subunit TctC
MIRRFLGAILLLAATSFSIAQDFPSKAIRLVSPFPPGGGTDLIARTIASKLSETKSWSVIVDNRAGANGLIGLTEVSRTKPTGYDLVVGQTDNLILGPVLQKVSFDPVNGFTPIGYIGGSPVVFLVAANGKYQSFPDVVAAAKANPGAITLGTSGSGSAAHITGELMRKRAGIQLQHVPYKGSAPALTDLLGGQIDVAGSSIASASAMIRGGKLKAIAVSGAARSPSLPDVPTLAELGVKNVVVDIWYGLFGPADLPSEIVKQLNVEVNTIVQRTDVKKILSEQGLEPKQGTDDDFSRFVRREYSTWKGIIAETGMKLD